MGDALEKMGEGVKSDDVQDETTGQVPHLTPECLLIQRTQIRQNRKTPRETYEAGGIRACDEEVCIGAPSYSFNEGARGEFSVYHVFPRLFISHAFLFLLFNFVLLCHIYFT